MNHFFTPGRRIFHPWWARPPPLVAATTLGFPREYAIFWSCSPSNKTNKSKRCDGYALASPHVQF